MGVPAERGKKPHRTIEHLQILPRQLFEIAIAKFAAERIGELFPHLVLVLRKTLHRHFQIGRNECLQAVAIEADQLPQEADWKQVLSLIFLLEYDLSENLSGDVLSGPRIADLEFGAFLHHIAELFERDVGRRTGVVESAIGIFFYDDRV